MVADMIRRGQLTEAESRYHPNRSVITRALGTDVNMLADTYDLEAAPGDRLLLCSDGLTGMLEDGMIAEILAEHRAPEAAAHALVDAANDAGGHDNISRHRDRHRRHGHATRLACLGKRSPKRPRMARRHRLAAAVRAGGRRRGLRRIPVRAIPRVLRGRGQLGRRVPGRARARSPASSSRGRSAIRASSSTRCRPTFRRSLKSGVEFPLSDLGKMEKLYSSRQSTTTRRRRPTPPHRRPTGSAVQ